MSLEAHFLEDLPLSPAERPRSVFMALRLGLVPVERMREAYEVLLYLEDQPKYLHYGHADPSSEHNNNGSWDDLIRAYEEDR